MDTAIRGTLALTMRDGRIDPIEDATVTVDDGEITAVGPSAEVEGDADRVIDGTNTVTTPGLVNVHAHTGLTVLRGGAQDVPEIEWMNRALGPLAERTSPQDHVAGSRLGVLEMVLSGVTTVGEYAGEVERLVDAVYDPAGVRVVATETINAVATEKDSLGPDEPYPLDPTQARDGLERNEQLFDRYADHPRVRPMYGPQALDMVPAATLEEIHERAVDGDRGIHMHVAQGARERRQIESRYGSGESTVSVLEDVGLVSDHLLAAHLHDASPEERKRLADAGVRMAANPSSIAAIDGITPPIVEYRDHGGVVGIGTDQAPGPGGHDFLRELRTACLLAKTDAVDPTAFPAWDALAVATVGGARALGIDDRVGTLEPGKRADIAVFDLDHPSIAPVVTDPLHTAVPNLVYGANGGLAEHVFVDGEPVVADGESTTIDAEETIAEANRRASDLFEAGADDWRAAGSTLVDRVDEGWL